MEPPLADAVATPPPRLDGVINLDKPPGLTSARAVSAVKRLLPRGTKIGHAGTLDPFATGVLLLLVGRGTKSCERMMDAPKQYEATVKFGSATDTDDLEGTETRWTPTHGGPIAPPPREQVHAALSAFAGAILQRPPAFSALKVGGRRAYDLARQGTAVELKPRIVRVYGIELLEYAWPLLRLRIDCGRGTYVRAIARDLGEALDVGGHLIALRRTRIGAFDVAAGVTLEMLRESGVGPHVRAIEAAPTDATRA